MWPSGRQDSRGSWKNGRSSVEGDSKIYTSYTISQPQSPSHLTQIPLTLQESFNIGSRLHRIHQLRQPWILLQPLSPILRQILIVADLVEHHIGVCETLSGNKRPRSGEVMGLEMSFQCLQEAVAVCLLVFRIGLFLVWVEEGLDEEGPPCSNY